MFVLNNFFNSIFNFVIFDFFVTICSSSICISISNSFSSFERIKNVNVFSLKWRWWINWLTFNVRIASTIESKTSKKLTLMISNMKEANFRNFFNFMSCESILIIASTTRWNNTYLILKLFSKSIHLTSWSHAHARSQSTSFSIKFESHIFFNSVVHIELSIAFERFDLSQRLLFSLMRLQKKDVRESHSNSHYQRCCASWKRLKSEMRCS